MCTSVRLRELRFVSLCNREDNLVSASFKVRVINRDLNLSETFPLFVLGSGTSGV